MSCSRCNGILPIHAVVPSFTRSIQKHLGWQTAFFFFSRKVGHRFKQIPVTPPNQTPGSTDDPQRGRVGVPGCRSKARQQEQRRRDVCPRAPTNMNQPTRRSQPGGLALTACSLLPLFFSTRVTMQEGGAKIDQRPWSEIFARHFYRTELELLEAYTCKRAPTLLHCSIQLAVHSIHSLSAAHCCVGSLPPGVHS